MNDSYTTTITVDRASAGVFDAINDLRGWWVAELEGTNDRVGAEFSYEVPDLHYCKMRVTALEPDELSGDEDRTEVRFTHVGLRPDHECFEVCRSAWNHYLGDSLRSLLTAGSGKPGTNPDEQRSEQPVDSVA